MKLFQSQKRSCALIGMVHLQALPGTPNHRASITQILDAALRDAQALVEGGCDALLVENMADLPYLNGSVGPEIVAAMAIAVDRIVTGFDLPVGLQVLAAANLEAMGIAACAGASFIRAEAFAYAHVADEGWINASAAHVLRLRKRLDADVRVFADVQKKHACHVVTSDTSLEDLSHGFAFCGADALIVTGVSTGAQANIQDVTRARSAHLPVIIGSGIDAQNAASFGAVADGLIVGSSIKIDGNWRNSVDVARVHKIAQALDELAKT
ncbi:MAG: BtpA/SgcQ family protein [Proteobacteria bacterium]|nr:BtpA/SgcQ family protein [Pseudomonadota bacterium]